jgi:type IV pilus assembly protein PilB
MILLDELVKQNILKENQVTELLEIAKEKYKGNIDDALLDFSIDEEKILEIKEELFNVPYKKIEPKSIPSATLKLIPVEAVKIYRFVPLNSSDNLLEVGIVDPENIQAVDALTFITTKLDKPFKLFLIKNSTYHELLERYQSDTTQEVDQALNELDSEIAGSADGGVTIESVGKTSDSLKPGEEEKIVEEAPIIKIVAVILRSATEGRASDIHIENTGEKVKVRFRVDGTLYTSLFLPLPVYNGVIARIKILSRLRLDEKRKPQDGGFSAKIDGRKIDFRVSTMPSYFGEKVVIRILDSEKGIKPLSELGLSQENLDLIKEALRRPYGLILMTGPTGSGKTSSLYSMLAELNKEDKNVVSLRRSD